MKEFRKGGSTGIVGRCPMSINKMFSAEEHETIPIDFPHELVTESSRAEEISKELMTKKALGVDTETTSLDPHILRWIMTQICDGKKTYIYDMRQVNPETLRAPMESNKILKIIQHIPFDYNVFRKQGIILEKMFCTSLAEQVLAAGISRESNLAYLVRKYMGFKMEKETRNTFKDIKDEPFTLRQIKYGLDDAAVLPFIYKEQVKALKQANLGKIAMLEFACAPAVAMMEYNGVKLNIDVWEGILLDAKEEQKKCSDKLIEFFEPYTEQLDLFGNIGINLGSQDQLKNWFKKAGYNLKDTKDETIRSMSLNNPIFEVLREFRKHTKILTTYGDSLLERIHQITGRLHPSVRQLGARSGRFSFCLSKGTKVSTDRGLVNIEDAKVNDYISTSYGKKRIRSKFESVIKEEWNLELENGSLLKCSGDHRWLIQNLEYKKTSELNLKDQLMSTSKCLGNSEYIKLNIDKDYFKSTKKNVKYPTFLDEKLAEFLGFMVSEGCFRKSKKRSKYDKIIIAFNFAEEQENAKYIQALLKKLFGLESKIKNPKGLKGSVEVASTGLCYFLKHLLEGVHFSIEEFIPKLIFESPVSVRRSFLKALFTGDGGINEGCAIVQYFTESELLAKDVQRLLWSCGISSIVKFSKIEEKDGRKRKRWFVVVNNPYSKLFMDHIGFIGKKNKPINPKKCYTYYNINLSEYQEEFLLLWGSIRKLKVLPISRNRLYHYRNGGRITCYKLKLLYNLFIKYEIKVPEIIKNIVERDLFPVGIKKVYNTRIKEVMYDIEVDEVHEFVADGFITKNSDPNLQQVPNESIYRHCFVARSGYKIITADYSQQELRIAAHASEDPVFIKFFKDDVDVHCRTAEFIYGVPWQDIHAAKIAKDGNQYHQYLDLYNKYRNIAKNVSFLILYGGTPHGLAMGIGIDIKEAEDIFKRYFAPFVRLDTFIEKTKADAVANRYAINLGGRKRFFRFPEPHTPEFHRIIGKSQRIAVNHMIQSTAADIMKLALGKFYSRIKNSNEIQLLLSVHDEIVIEAEEKIAKDAEKELVKIMEESFVEYCPTVPIKVDSVIEDYWTK